ncbi:MAG: YggT family protein [Candidatus Dormibacteraceae bacterium]
MSVLASLIQIICYALIVAIFVRVAFSWFSPRRSSGLYGLYELSYKITEPVLRPIRNLLPMAAGIDISPMLVTIVLFFVISLTTRF